MMELQTKFAIIIPTYNRPDKIKKAIRSVQQQTFFNWEIYVVDDCSDVQYSSEIWEDIKDKVKYYRLDKNRGHCYARNFALQQIENGVWVKYLDDDDEILPTCLENLNDFIVKNPDVDVISTNYIKRFDTCEKICETNYHKYSVFSGKLDTCAICHKKDLYEQIGGWDERLYRMADDDFFFNYISNGNYGYCNVVTSVFYDTSDEDRVTNICSNLKYCNIIAEKYDYFKNNRCLILTNNEGNIMDENYNIESFMPFDVSNTIKKGYKYIIKYDKNDSLNDIFQKKYHLEKLPIRVGNSILIKGV